MAATNASSTSVANSLNDDENRTTTAVIDKKNDEQTIDEVDEYLDQLALDLKTKDQTSSTNNQQQLKANNLQNNSVPNQSTFAHNNAATTTTAQTQKTHATSLPMLLFGLITILAFVNSVRCKRILIHTIPDTFNRFRIYFSRLYLLLFC